MLDDRAGHGGKEPVEVREVGRRVHAGRQVRRIAQVAEPDHRVNELSIPVLDLPFEHTLARASPQVGLEEAHRDALLRMDLEQAAKRRHDLVDAAEMRRGKAAPRERGHRNDVDLAVGKPERHRHVVGRAIGAQVAEDRKVELDVIVLEMAAHATGAADDRGERTVGEPRLQQDVVRLEDDPHIGDIVAPHEHGGEDLRMQRGNDDGRPGDGIAGGAEEAAELPHQRLRRARLPGLFDQPARDRVAMNGVAALVQERHLLVAFVQGRDLVAIERRSSRESAPHRDRGPRRTTRRSRPPCPRLSASSSWRCP